MASVCGSFALAWERRSTGCPRRAAVSASASSSSPTAPVPRCSILTFIVSVRGWGVAPAAAGAGGRRCIDGPASVLVHAGARQGGEPADGAQVHQLHAPRGQRFRQPSVLRVDLAQPPREGVAAGGGEEVVVRQVHADQADAGGAHVRGEAHRHVRRVLRVVQRVVRVRLGAPVPAQAEADDARAHAPQLELREQRSRAGLLHVPEAVVTELPARVHHHQVGGVEQPPHVVDADGDVALRVRQRPRRGAAAADHDGLARVGVPVRREAPGRGAGWAGGACHEGCMAVGRRGCAGEDRAKADHPLRQDALPMVAASNKKACGSVGTCGAAG
jgi:hypothetical protein